MNYHVMTLFPELIETVLSSSIIGRARAAGFIDVKEYNFREFCNNKHGRVDDTPYGGGKGMLLMAPPIYDCWEHITKDIPEGRKVRTVYMSPKGRLLTHSVAKELSEYDDLIILCGHYEGVDERLIEEIVDDEISIGDYILTGGEIPACILVDAVARMVPGVLADSSCYEDESIASGLLEYPHYTRPYNFRGRVVPDVLISGHHGNVDKWRREKALEITAKNRPDLLEKLGEKKD